MQLPEHLAQLLDGPDAARGAAIGDEGDRLCVPGLVDRIDQFLERRRIAVIVFGRDDDEGVGLGDLALEPLARIDRSAQPT
ncbi:hypothetical protein D9M72_549950 [compost metagenome]